MTAIKIDKVKEIAAVQHLEDDREMWKMKIRKICVKIIPNRI